MISPEFKAIKSLRDKSTYKKYYHQYAALPAGTQKKVREEIRSYWARCERMGVPPDLSAVAEIIPLVARGERPYSGGEDKRADGRVSERLSRWVSDPIANNSLGKALQRSGGIKPF